MIRLNGFIPINIYPIFWVLSFAIGYFNGSTPLEIFIWVGIIFLSVLIHEYGHALTAVFFGQKAHIDLLGFGGLTHRHGKKLAKWQDFFIILNGPLAGLLLVLSCYLLFALIQPTQGTLLDYILKATFFINIYWTALNLLPVQPLDGGHLLNTTLEGLFGVRGLKVALFISLFVAVAIACLGFLLHQLFIGIIFFMFAFENFQLLKKSFQLTEFDQDTVIQNMMKNAKKELVIGNSEGALRQLEEIRALTKKGVTFIAATEMLAEVLDQLGKYKEGFDLLYPLSKELSPPSLLLLQKMAFHSGEFKAAAETGKKVYQSYPEYEVALINALSYALLNNEEASIGWLECAIREGMPNIRAILTKSEFDNIRQSDRFRRLVEKFNSL